MNLKIYLMVVCLFGTLISRAQIGGEATYQFLELTNSARIAALGGVQIALSDPDDLNMPFYNPALLHQNMNNVLLVNYVNYMADINYGYASYSPRIKLPGTFAVGMQYINYGDFKEATETGELTGNFFKAAEYALNLMYANNYNRLNYGINIKPVYSAFESYQSLGIAADVGVVFTSDEGFTTVAVVARNIGGQLTTYYEDGNKEPIPFNMQTGISTRLKHAPVVLSLTMQHLTNWDLAWNESDDNLDLESWYERQEGFAKQIMRHAVLGLEILPSENFTLRAGYNYQRRQELKFEERLSTVGFSMGFGLKIRRFTLDFATSRFHLAGSSNLFSLAINLNERF